MSLVSLPQGYENKVLTGDKLYTLVSLIKQELGNKATANDVLQAIDDYLLDNGIDINDHEIDITLGDQREMLEASTLNWTGFNVKQISADEYEANAAYGSQEASYEFKSITDELYHSGTYAGGGFGISVSEYDPQNDMVGDVLAEFAIDTQDDGTIAMTASGADGETIPVLLNGEHLATIEGIITELGADSEMDTLLNAVDARIPDVSGFVTASDVSTAISGKQDALVFNTAYNASSNKVATMADIPSVSAFQTASDVQTAITTAISGITSFSFEIVQALPVSNISQTTIYLVLKSSGPSGNIYTEYAYVKTGTDDMTGNDIYGWEILGDTQADIAVLSTAEVTAIWNYQPPAEEEDPGL